MRLPLLIVGAGRLGARVGQQWDGEVTAETLTDRSHAALKKQGMMPRLKSLEGRFENVLFAVPPTSSNESYEEEVKRALFLWKRRGSFLFVSSTGVYEEDEGGIVSEISLEGTSERALRLLAAEDLVEKQKGIVVRLAGLYDSHSGPHRVFLNKETSDLRGDAWINLIHYDDAAKLCLKILDKGETTTFLGCDSTPLTRQELSRLAGKLTAGAPACQFLGIAGPLGKRCDNSFTRNVLHWTAQWESFASFVKQEREKV